MKIIEKKCPNCGAGLKFDIKDKETKCKYCNSEFVIKDNNTDSKNINLDDIKLNKKIIKVFSTIHIIITLIILCTIIVTLFLFNNINSTSFSSTKIHISINEVNEKIQKKLSNASINEIKNWDIIHTKYKLQGEYEDFGYYYLKNKLGVKVIYILKYTYSNESDSKTIYTAFKFTGKSLDSLSYKPYIDTNRIELDDFDFVYGYETVEELFDSVVRSDKSLGYKIVASKDLYID